MILLEICLTAHIQAFGKVLILFSISTAVQCSLAVCIISLIQISVSSSCCPTSASISPCVSILKHLDFPSWSSDLIPQTLGVISGCLSGPWVLPRNLWGSALASGATGHVSRPQGSPGKDSRQVQTKFRLLACIGKLGAPVCGAHGRGWLLTFLQGLEMIEELTGRLLWLSVKRPEAPGGGCWGRMKTSPGFITEDCSEGLRGLLWPSPGKPSGSALGVVSGPVRGPGYSAVFPNGLLLPGKEVYQTGDPCLSGPSSDGSLPLIRLLPFSTLTPTLRQASLLVTHMTGLAGICARRFLHIFLHQLTFWTPFAHGAAPSSAFCFLCLCPAAQSLLFVYACAC